MIEKKALIEAIALASGAASVAASTIATGVMIGFGLVFANETLRFARSRIREWREDISFQRSRPDFRTRPRYLEFDRQTGSIRESELD